MELLRKILNHFGFPIRELAEVLGHSPSQILNVERKRRSASSQLTQTLSHPLFAEVDTSYIPEQENDPNKKEWLQVQLLEAEARHQAELAKWKVIQKKRDGAQKIIHHTAGLDMAAPTGLDLVADWWCWQRDKALLWLQERKPKKEWELERKVYLAEQEIEWLKNKIAEA